LIRDSKDTGLLVLADRRLRATRYGKIFLDSLPPMKPVHDLTQVKAFFG